MSIAKKALGLKPVQQKVAEAPPAKLRVSEQLPATVKQTMFAHFKTAGIELRNPVPVSGNEKVAEAPDFAGLLQKKAEVEVLSNVAAAIYQDPILSKLASVGNWDLIRNLAVGRVSDAQTLDKLASLGTEKIAELATEGLKKRTLNKLASIESQPAARRAFVGFNKRGGLDND